MLAYNTGMLATPKLGVFDVDGTIALHGKVPESVLNGLDQLHQHGCLTTVSTGRGYVRLREGLGDAFDKVVSQEAPLIVEHGTRIVNSKGQTIFGAEFNEQEIQHIIDFTRANIGLFKLVWFNPSDTTIKIPVWCADEKDLDYETEKRGHYANVFTSSIGELQELLLKYRPTNVTLKLKDYIKVENLKLAFTRTETTVIFQDGNMEFVKNNTNKALAIEYITHYLDIDVSTLLVAGNAINDVEMLDIDSGYTILVGSDETRQTIRSYMSKTNGIIEVDTPTELGNYLVKL
jgi:HAD superfamily hydrolase (TIGR01484 family)